MRIFRDGALVDLLVGDVADLDGLADHCEPAERAVTLADRLCAEKLDELERQLVGGVQIELLALFAVLVDGAAVHARSCVARETIVREHRLEVERRAHRLTDFAQRLELADRLRELGGARLQFHEQSDVLDRDHRLIGERLQQCDLVFRKMDRVRGRPTVMAPIGLPSRNRGTASALRNPAASAKAPTAYAGSSKTSGTTATLRVRIALVVALSWLGGRGKMLRIASAPFGSTFADRADADQLAVERRDDGGRCRAELQRGRRDRVEHGLHIGRRLADHAQDLARRRLLLERLGEIAIARFELVEQTHVLDRDHRLVGEGLDQRDLLSPRTVPVRVGRR